MLGFTVFGFNYTKVTGILPIANSLQKRNTAYTHNIHLWGMLFFCCYALNAITTSLQSLEIEAELLLHVLSRSVEVFIFIT